MLQILAQHAGKVVTRQEIMKQAWGGPTSMPASPVFGPPRVPQIQIYGISKRSTA